MENNYFIDGSSLTELIREVLAEHDGGAMPDGFSDFPDFAVDDDE
jgi:hypothetical protein